MSKSTSILSIALLALVSSCQNEAAENSKPSPAPARSGAAEATGKTTPATGGAAAEKPDPAPVNVLKQPPAPAMWQGKVIETMTSGGYSYVHLDAGDRKVWLAGPEVAGIAAGKEVAAPTGMLMRDFSSKTLERSFPEIYFVDAFQVAGVAAAPSKGADPHAGVGAGTAKKATTGKVEGVAKAEGGYTVAEILAKKAELAGKPVKVRGKVVKFSARIMGTNWLHIRDGSGEEGSADLTVTTDATVAVDDIVLVEGALTVDKDFGAGYRYDAIIEKAKVSKQ